MFRLSCGLYDQLEVFSMRKTKVEITYINNEGVEFKKDGIITDILAKNGEEFIVFNNDNKIKTQDIISVNDLNFK
jgi:hypothetical protein